MTDPTLVRVYNLACEGVAAARIAELLGLSKQTVAHHVQRLLRDGRIRHIRGTAKPKLYVRGPNPLGEPAQDDHRGWLNIRTDPHARSHHTSWIAEVIEEGEGGILWEQGHTTSGTHYKYLRKFLVKDTPVGNILVKTIRYCIGKEKSSLTVWLDEDFLYTSEAIKAHEFDARELARHVFDSFRKHKWRISDDIHPMQPSHYAGVRIPISPAVAEYGARMGIRSEHVWFDESLDLPEIEADLEREARSWVDLTKHLGRMYSLHDRHIKDDVSGRVAFAKLVELVELLVIRQKDQDVPQGVLEHIKELDGLVNGKGGRKPAAPEEGMFR